MVDDNTGLRGRVAWARSSGLDAREGVARDLVGSASSVDVDALTVLLLLNRNDGAAGAEFGIVVV